MEKKKKGKGIVITIIVVIVLLAGGCLVHDTVSEQNNTEDTEVEIKKVGSVNGGFSSRDNYIHREICRILDENDATYYEIQEEDGELNVLQINKKDFNKIGSVNSKQAILELKKCLTLFLNRSYDNLPSTIYAPEDIPDYDTTIFGRVMGARYDTWVIETFGEELGKMFKDYKLKLSCDEDEIEVEKMAVYDTKTTTEITMGGVSSYEPYYEYYFITTAKVTTVNATGDISKLGVFPNEGESKKIKLCFRCDSFEGYQSLTLDGIYKLD